MLYLTPRVLALFVLSLLNLAVGSPLLAAEMRSHEAAPRPSFDDTILTVSGVTPGGRLLVGTVSIRIVDELRTIRKQSYLAADEDLDGVVTIGVTGRVPRRSIWFLIDEQTGEYTVASPFGFALRPLEFPGDGLSHGPRGALQRVSLKVDHLDLILVRPGVGVWLGNTKDGTTTDADEKKDGRASFDIERMSSPDPTLGSPRRFEPGDRLFAVDRNTFRFFVARQGR